MIFLHPERIERAILNGYKAGQQEELPDLPEDLLDREVQRIVKARPNNPHAVAWVAGQRLKLMRPVEVR
jgi:hypothetical protein